MQIYGFVLYKHLWDLDIQFYLKVNIYYNTLFTHCSVFACLGEYNCICEKKKKAFYSCCGSRGMHFLCMLLDTCLHSCHSVAKLHCGKWRLQVSKTWTHYGLIMDSSKTHDQNLRSSSFFQPGAYITHSATCPTEWHCWRKSLRLHAASSGATNSFILLCFVVHCKTCKHT